MDNFRVTNMTATFQLWISASSICLSFLHLIFNIINLAVRVNWYQLLAKHGINSEYHPQRFHAIIQRCKCRESSITASIFKSGRGIDWWNFGCWMSKSCFTCMSSHQPCSLQGFIENTTQTLRSLSLQTSECCMRFQVPTSSSDQEDVRGLLQMASSIQLIKQESEDGLPTYKFCGPSNCVQK